MGCTFGLHKLRVTNFAVCLSALTVPPNALLCALWIVQQEHDVVQSVNCKPCRSYPAACRLQRSVLAEEMHKIQ